MANTDQMLLSQRTRHSRFFTNFRLHLLREPALETSAVHNRGDACWNPGKHCLCPQIACIPNAQLSCVLSEKDYVCHQPDRQYSVKPIEASCPVEYGLTLRHVDKLGYPHKDAKANKADNQPHHSHISPFSCCSSSVEGSRIEINVWPSTCKQDGGPAMKKSSVQHKAVTRRAARNR